jgi:hypothetical protein
MPDFPFQISPYFVIGSALLAVIEIALLRNVPSGYRWSICILIFMLASLYFLAEVTPSSFLSMHNKAFLLRLDLTVFLLTLANIARMVGQAQPKGNEHEVD